MSSSKAELAALLKDAVLEASDRVSQTIDEAINRLPDEARLLDDLERMIDDVAQPRVQSELRRLLEELDENRKQVRWTLESITPCGDLDPIRAIATDLTSGFL